MGRRIPVLASSRITHVSAYATGASGRQVTETVTSHPFEILAVVSTVK